MNRSRYRAFFVLFAVFTLTESRRYHLVSSSRGGAQVPSVPLPSAGSQVPSQQVEDQPKAVLVKCHSDAMELVLQADLFNTGLPVEPAHLRLGSDPAGASGACRARPTGDGDSLTISADLLDCGTLRSSTQDKIIYSNVLVYSPEPSDGFLRLDGATIPVECHFDRRYSVGGISMHPTWIPSVSVGSAESSIDFKLRLMTDNWQFERRSHAYFMGDPIHLEVSAAVRKHQPLRVYAERCTATAGPDPHAALRYDFVERNGCLTDALHTNSSSHFLPRHDGHTLQLQLEAFRFHQQPDSQVYITCWLRAVPDSLVVSSQNRACSFIDNRWRSVDGDHGDCSTCHPLAAPKETTTTTTDRRLYANSGWNFAPNKPRQPTTSLRSRPERLQSYTYQQTSSGLMRQNDHKPVRFVQLGPLSVE
ncbi:zona pellucida sperm-binding protein 3-like [Hippocampus comes]|uniref:zona pellucida sperm-binding protein 3-like n=1 Tax=Hippocampus comes TaxID=109280 RepID=UPI00094F0387|nr:PREDICTED: zona pellucida sperm-binding protein 3-like [Hippocampus comes]